MPEEIKEQNPSESSEEGSQPEIDWSTIDPSTIPVDLVKSHDEYKSVLSESIERRKEIKALKEKEQPTPAPQEEETPANDGLKALQAQISALQEQLGEVTQTAAQRQEEASLMELKTKHNLATEDVDLLRSTDPGKRSALAARLQPSSGSGSATNDSLEQQKSALENRLDERMKNGGAINPFDPAIHRRQGGGVIKRH